MKFLPPIFTVAILSLPNVIFAQESVYAPLVDLSNAGQGNNVQTFEQYINFLYGMSIAVAALLAVIKIIIAGAKYMLSDVISNKGEALKDIQGAILGLLLILSAVIILELINPQLTEKSITFPGFQSERGQISSPAVRVANGQTIEQHSSELAEGLDTCVPRPETSTRGNNSVTIINVSACGDRTKQLEQIGIFERNCTAANGRASSQGNGNGIVLCTTPLIQAAPLEFADLGDYGGVDWNIGVFNSEAIYLSEQYVERRGSLWVYNYVQQCRDELGPSWQTEGYVAACKESIIDYAMFGSCSGFGSLCNRGWCHNNAGRREDVQTAGNSLPGCRLPIERFTESQVRNKYNEITPADVRANSFYDMNAYTRACRELGGEPKDINLYGSAEENRRCVRY